DRPVEPCARFCVLAPRLGEEGEIRVGAKAVGLERGGLFEVGGSFVESALLEPDRAAVDQERVAGVVVGMELRGLGGAGLRAGGAVQLTSCKAAREVDPECIRPLGQTRSEVDLGQVGPPGHQLTGREVIAGPETTRLEPKRLVEMAYRRGEVIRRGF